MASTKTYVLKSSDEKLVKVSESAAALSRVIKNSIDDCPDDTISVPNVDGKTLDKVVEYCEKHSKLVEGEGKDVDFKAYDEEFLKVGNNTLFYLLSAAHYLDIESLQVLTCQKLADMMKNMSVEEVRTLFNRENDFTPEEEENLRKEYSWAFEE